MREIGHEHLYEHIFHGNVMVFSYQHQYAHTLT